MKNLLFLLTFLFCYSNAYPYSDSKDTDSTIIPIKKVTKKPKLSKANNRFILSNPYKINTLCRLIQVGNYKAVKSLIKKGTKINDESIKLTPYNLCCQT